MQNTWGNSCKKKTTLMQSWSDQIIGAGPRGYVLLITHIH
eukprot:SAG25_NODE_34_length_20232_cov_4.725534_3_plen_40_part_00